MHKRTIEVLRLSSPVLLILLLLVPSHASAAGPTAGLGGPEQPEALFEPSDIPRVDDIPEIGYVYTVIAGDDVWLIAMAHGISMETLVAANRLESPYWIYPGDRLFVPAEPAVVKHPPPPAPESTAPDPDPAVIAMAEEAGADAAMTGTVETSTPVTGTVEGTAPVTGTVETSTPVTGTVETSTPVTGTVEGTAAVSSTTETMTISPAPPDPPVEAQVAQAVLSDDTALILGLINEKRTARGLAVLNWSVELAQAAQGHAIDCAQRGWGSHVGSDGARLRTRLSRAGYYASWASENWANSRNAQHAFEMWWYEGPGGSHYENILGPNYTEIGIALAKGGWGYYVVVDFGNR